MAVAINHSDLSPQPSQLIERKIQIQTDQVAIDGSLQRNRIGEKKESVLTWKNILASDFQTINNNFTTGSGVYYNNPTSKYGTFTFSGMPYIEQESEYVPGSSLLTDYTVRIREI